jgi:regulator of cell morphogenesis and NO signaling
MTASIDPGATLATIVTEHPATARHLERLGLDYCCGGRRSLAAACAAQGLDVAAVAASLAGDDGGPPADWAAMGPADLVDHLEATHHRYLHDELPRLVALADKVLGAHGARHPELAEVRALVGELRADLEPHLAKEEEVLFPRIRALFSAGESPSSPCGPLRQPISVMLAEHDRTGVILDRLRRTAGDYTVPADACASYRALYAGLAELEHDTHLHVHKENNLLFPAVGARDAERP